MFFFIFQHDSDDSDIEKKGCITEESDSTDEVGINKQAERKANERDKKSNEAKGFAKQQTTKFKEDGRQKAKKGKKVIFTEVNVCRISLMFFTIFLHASQVSHFRF